MGGWFVLNLGEAPLAGARLEDAKALFLHEFEIADRPPDMALFFRHESEGRLHCELHLYFSPRAASVAQAMEAEPCPRPSPDGLDLLAGPESAMALLRPDTHA